MPLMAAVAQPPDLFVARRLDVCRLETGIFYWMPLGCDVRLEIRQTAARFRCRPENASSHVPTLLTSAPSSGARVNRRRPLVATRRADPPHPDTATRQHISRFQVVVLCRMPFASELRQQVGDGLPGTGNSNHRGKRIRIVRQGSRLPIYDQGQRVAYIARCPRSTADQCSTP
jgi:hypothetical protein